MGWIQTFCRDNATQWRRIPSSVFGTHTLLMPLDFCSPDAVLWLTFHATLEGPLTFRSSFGGGAKGSVDERGGPFMGKVCVPSTDALDLMHRSPLFLHPNGIWTLTFMGTAWTSSQLFLEDFLVCPRLCPKLNLHWFLITCSSSSIGLRTYMKRSLKP